MGGAVWAAEAVVDQAAAKSPCPSRSRPCVRRARASGTSRMRGRGRRLRLGADDFKVERRGTWTHCKAEPTLQQLPCPRPKHAGVARAPLRVPPRTMPTTASTSPTSPRAALPCMAALLLAASGLWSSGRPINRSRLDVGDVVEASVEGRCHPFPVRPQKRVFLEQVGAPCSACAQPAHRLCTAKGGRASLPHACARPCMLPASRPHDGVHNAQRTPPAFLRAGPPPPPPPRAAMDAGSGRLDAPGPSSGMQR